MSKESMSERFDAEFPSPDGQDFLGMERISILKAFLRKELADQKARAIEIVRDNPCKMSGRVPHNHTATCNRAIAISLEEKL